MGHRSSNNLQKIHFNLTVCSETHNPMPSPITQKAVMECFAHIEAWGMEEDNNYWAWNVEYEWSIIEI